MSKMRPGTKIRLLLAVAGLATVLGLSRPAEASWCGGMWITSYYDDNGALIGQEGQTCSCQYWSYGSTSSNSFTHWDYC